MSTASNPLLNIKLINPKQTLYNGQAKTLTSENDQGTFDILPQHIQFLTLIKNHLTIVDDQQQLHTYDFQKGVLRVLNNQIDAYIVS